MTPGGKNTNWRNQGPLGRDGERECGIKEMEWSDKET